MTRGAPDWSNVRKGAAVYRLDDMAELAARLGSIVNFDRRGDVIMLDGFEDGFSRWSWGSGFGSGSRALATYPVKSGAISCRLKTGADIGDVTQLTLTQPYPVLSQLGLEVAFQPTTSVYLMDFNFLLYDGAQLQAYRLSYDPVNLLLLYRDSGGSYATLATLGYAVPVSGALSVLKLVVDPVNQKYVRAILNGVTYSMAGIAVQAAANSAGPYLYLNFGVQNVGANIATAYLDDVIITQNEP